MTYGPWVICWQQKYIWYSLIFHALMTNCHPHTDRQIDTQCGLKINQLVFLHIESIFHPRVYITKMFDRSNNFLSYCVQKILVYGLLWNLEYRFFITSSLSGLLLIWCWMWGKMGLCISSDVALMTTEIKSTR